MISAPAALVNATSTATGSMPDKPAANHRGRVALAGQDSTLLNRAPGEFRAVAMVMVRCCPLPVSIAKIEWGCVDQANRGADCLQTTGRGDDRIRVAGAQENLFSVV